MSRSVHLRQSFFSIHKRNYEPALRAVVDYAVAKRGLARNPLTIFHCLQEMGFSADENDEGIYRVRYHRDWEPDLTFLEYLAPFVQSGSYLEFSDEYADIYRWVFDGRTILEIRPKISWDMPT